VFVTEEAALVPEDFHRAGEGNIAYPLVEREIEVLISTGATIAKVEANNTAIKHIQRTGRGFVNSANYTARITLRSAARTPA
jgi:hypothetical protein